jgi:hypothetical protein
VEQNDEGSILGPAGEDMQANRTGLHEEMIKILFDAHGRLSLAMRSFPLLPTAANRELAFVLDGRD